MSKLKLEIKLHWKHAAGIALQMGSLLLATHPLCAVPMLTLGTWLFGKSVKDKAGVLAALEAEAESIVHDLVDNPKSE